MISNFFGGDSRRDIRAAKASSDKALTEGYQGANDYYNQAYGVLDPYAARGEAGASTYNQAIGLGTPEQQAAAQSRFFNDPAQQAILGQSTNALLRKYNAQGSGTGGGRLALAGARIGNEQYNGWLNRLQSVGSEGASVAGAQSGIRSGQGDSRYNYGAAMAGNAVNAGNALSATRNMGINNLIGLATAGAKAYGAFTGGK